MAKCIRTPQNKSKKVIILSRSSNDHNNGDKQPRSINIQATANRQLKTRVKTPKISLKWQLLPSVKLSKTLKKELKSSPMQ